MCAMFNNVQNEKVSNLLLVTKCPVSKIVIDEVFRIYPDQTILMMREF